MYLVEREVDELQVLLVDKRVVGQGDQLVVTQVEFKQIDETLKHGWTGFPEVVVRDVEIVQLLRHLERAGLDHGDHVLCHIQPLEGYQ